MIMCWLIEWMKSSQAQSTQKDILEKGCEI